MLVCKPPQVCEDLKAILRIQGCEFFRASVNRPNLFYEVRHANAPTAACTGVHYERPCICSCTGALRCIVSS